MHNCVKNILRVTQAYFMGCPIKVENFEVNTFSNNKENVNFFAPHHRSRKQ